MRSELTFIASFIFAYFYDRFRGERPHKVLKELNPNALVQFNR
ncbi:MULTISPECIES: hypothetical protein [Cyanophyceae]|nr:hypothetical protein [Phormidium sp. FACHB-592]